MPPAVPSRFFAGLTRNISLDVSAAASTRAASASCGSFISTSDCSGVLVLWRRTVQKLRSDASKAIIAGGGDVRFQIV